NPLDVGDNLPIPADNSGWQTWWGFPTWRETLSPAWTDPTVQVNVAQAQPAGLVPLTSTEVQSGHVDPTRTLLPPMDQLSGWRTTPQLFSDGWPPLSQNGLTIFKGPADPLWLASWEDDLIMTGVRSFDVKAYDNALANYADLGWGDNYFFPRNYAPLFSPPTG